jgi:hypothetical protein
LYRQKEAFSARRRYPSGKQEERIMIDRYFRDHPRSVGETYFQHLGTASGFAGTMIVAGVACLIHAFVPGLFVRTGSAAIGRLNKRMITNRSRTRSHPDLVEQAAISE